MRKRRPIRFQYDFQLDLHGLTVDDALDRLKDLMYRQVGVSILVIHGRGDGRLKTAIREFLAGEPYVLSTCYGEDLNLPGGDGLTVIEV